MDEKSVAVSFCPLFCFFPAANCSNSLLQLWQFHKDGILGQTLRYEVSQRLRLQSWRKFHSLISKKSPGSPIERCKANSLIYYYLDLSLVLVFSSKAKSVML